VCASVLCAACCVLWCGVVVIGVQFSVQSSVVERCVGLTSPSSFLQSFFLQMNVAVGGTGAFFPDVLCKHKPWSNGHAEEAQGAFVSAFERWWPTWGGNVSDIGRGASRSAAMAVEWVRYWKP
jgi:hypothetical protein